MRKSLVLAVVFVLVLGLTPILGTTFDSSKKDIVEIGNAINLGNFNADEVFIPIATGDYIVWGQKDVDAVNLYSCNVNTKEVKKINSESFRIYTGHIPPIWSQFQTDG